MTHIDPSDRIPHPVDNAILGLDYAVLSLAKATGAICFLIYAIAYGPNHLITVIRDLLGRIVA